MQQSFSFIITKEIQVLLRRIGSLLPGEAITIPAKNASSPPG
jgi:hypothetical protein